MFLCPRHKYHHHNEEYTSNNLKCIRSFVLDKDVDDKSCDRKCKLENTRTRCMNMFDTTVIHRRTENAR